MGERRAEVGTVRRRAAKKRRNKFIEDVNKIDYKDLALLKRFISDRGKILPRRMTGATAKCQRKLKSAILRARAVGLLPYCID
ncbi:30S ribosomal protein S18 [Candidatus Margulisiibacteriota bacterium]